MKVDRKRRTECINLDSESSGSPHDFKYGKPHNIVMNQSIGVDSSSFKDPVEWLDDCNGVEHRDRHELILNEKYC